MSRRIIFLDDFGQGNLGDLLTTRYTQINPEGNAPSAEIVELDGITGRVASSQPFGSIYTNEEWYIHNSSPSFRNGRVELLFYNPFHYISGNRVAGPNQPGWDNDFMIFLRWQDNLNYIKIWASRYLKTFTVTEMVAGTPNYIDLGNITAPDSSGPLSWRPTIFETLQPLKWVLDLQDDRIEGGVYYETGAIIAPVNVTLSRASEGRIGFGSRKHVTGTNAWRYLSISVPALVPDIISQGTSIALDSLFIDASLNLVAPRSEVLVEPVEIYDPSGTLIHRAYLDELTWDTEAQQVSLITSLAYLGRFFPKDSLAEYGPFTGGQVLTKLLTHFQKSFPQIRFSTTMPVFSIEGFTLTYEALRLIIDPEAPQLNSISQWLDEFFGFVPGYYFTDRLGELVFFREGEGDLLVLEDHQIASISESESLSRRINRCTISYKPWEYVDTRDGEGRLPQVMKPSAFYVLGKREANGLTQENDPKPGNADITSRANLGGFEVKNLGTKTTVGRWRLDDNVLINATEVELEVKLSVYSNQLFSDVDQVAYGETDHEFTLPLDGEEHLIFGQSLTIGFPLLGDVAYFQLWGRWFADKQEIELSFFLDPVNQSVGYQLLGLLASGLWLHSVLVELDGFAASYIESEQEYSATFGTTDHYSELPGLSVSQARYGVLEEKLELKIVTFEPLPVDNPPSDPATLKRMGIVKALLAMAKGRVKKLMAARREYTVEQVMPYVITPLHIGRKVQLPTGAEGIIIDYSRNDNYASPNAISEASTIRVWVTENLLESMQGTSGYRRAVYQQGRYR